MTAIGQDTLKARRTLQAGGKSYDYYSLDTAAHVVQAIEAFKAQESAQPASGDPS